MGLIGRAVLRATIVAGTLDILSAVLLTRAAGKPVAGMLSRVASGPLGGWPAANPDAAPWAGLLVHFALMAVMAAVFVAAVRTWPALLLRPVLAGVAYGVLIYLIMYHVVVPTRWPDVPRNLTLRGVLIPVAVHILLVGLPIAFIARATLGRR